MTNKIECDRCHKFYTTDPKEWGCLLVIRDKNWIYKIRDNFITEPESKKDLCRECFLFLNEWVKPL